MSLSMYQASIPVCVRQLEILSSILKKAEAHAEAKKIDPEVFLNARLAPDMYPLIRQVQIAGDMVKGCAARLSGQAVPSYEDTEKTFAELQARLAKTIAFARSVDPSQVDGSEDRKVMLKIRGVETEFNGQPYLLDFVLPNVYFHMTVAYAILRHNGVELGKRDFLGRN
ncbi:MAG: DUF1993 family protein [Candidatus Omnitrophota bacterium]